MTQPLKVRQRPLIALVTLASVLSLGGAPAASADDDDDQGRDGRDRYAYDHRYRDDYGDRHRDWEGRGHYKKKHYDKHHRGSYYYDSGRYDGYYYDRYYDRGRFVAPHHLYHRDYGAYDRYYRGPVYYAPHHHKHRVYYFPVIIGGYTEYRPYAYCGDAYFPAHYGYAPYDGAHGYFGLHFGF